tara:strand:- start:555 stop:1343 length:789 start_codon:yes stop_codon:yes gene_type:complete
MAVKEAFEGQDDYTWDDFGDVERSWDDWFNEKWDPGGIFQTITSKSIFGTWSSPATPNLTFSQSTFGTWCSPATPNLSFSQSTFGTWSSTSFPNIASTVTGNANFAPAVMVSAFGGLFTPSLNANFAPAALVAITLGTFSTSSNANAIFRPDSNPTAVASLESNANYANAALNSAISAFNTQLTTGRYISIADPFNMAKALQETRLYKLLIETRLLELNDESRVNSIKQETRIELVNQETRVLKIKRPGFTDNSTIPRVRGN